MNDRDLLVLAAKATGKDLRFFPYELIDWCWNPLRDDGAALRLANKLHLSVCHTTSGKALGHGTAMVGLNVWEHNSAPIAAEHYKTQGEADAATRRAIVRAAAEIGHNM